MKRFLEHGVPIVICTDSSGIQGVSLKEEITKTCMAQGFSKADLEKILQDSKKYSLNNLARGRQ